MHRDLSSESLINFDRFSKIFCCRNTHHPHSLIEDFSRKAPYGDKDHKNNHQKKSFDSRVSKSRSLELETLS